MSTFRGIVLSTLFRIVLRVTVLITPASPYSILYAPALIALRLLGVNCCSIFVTHIIRVSADFCQLMFFPSPTKAPGVRILFIP